VRTWAQPLFGREPDLELLQAWRTFSRARATRISRLARLAVLRPLRLIP